MLECGAIAVIRMEDASQPTRVNSGYHNSVVQGLKVESVQGLIIISWPNAVVEVTKVQTQTSADFWQENLRGLVENGMRRRSRAYYI
jgi:hypothetical protein